MSYKIFFFSSSLFDSNDLKLSNDLFYIFRIINCSAKKKITKFKILIVNENYFSGSGEE
jgi:hypothetical protein